MQFRSAKMQLMNSDPSVDGSLKIPVEGGSSLRACFLLVKEEAVQSV